jgi:hypothetical protein
VTSTLARSWWWIAAVLVGGAAAQAPAVVYVPTGTLTATIDGEAVVFATHAHLVPTTDTAAIRDADARALAETLTGREVNTASFVYTEPLVVNGITAMPATLTVVLRAKVAPDDRDERRELVLSFGLDPVTLAPLDDPRRVSVEYHPERWRATAHYVLLDLRVFDVTLLEAVEPHALRAAGRLEATLAWRSGSFQATIDPADSVELRLDFEAYPVVGDDVLVPLLEDAAGGG